VSNNGQVTLQTPQKVGKDESSDDCRKYAGLLHGGALSFNL